MNLNRGILRVHAEPALGLLLVGATFLIAGCGGGSIASPAPTPTPAPTATPPSPSGVVVSCTPAAVLSNGTSQCAALVAPAGASQNVTWTTGQGTITATGLYTAPNSAIIATIIATSVVNPAISGSTAILVTVPASSPPAPTSVTVTCPTPMNSGGMEQCGATVLPSGASPNVTWSVSLGTISQSGVLTAPSVTVNTNLIVTATAANTTTAGNFTVVVDAPPPAPSVTGVMVTCQTPISSAATSQCAATVSPSTVAQTVTWSDSAGTISGTGLFTAPTVTTTTNVTVTATSTADTTKSGTFIVVVNAPAPPTVTGVTVMCAPTVNGNSTDQCVASVSPSTVAQTVTWSATGGVSISSNGSFLAPVVTTNTNITVTATSTVDTTKAGTFTVTILAQPSTAPMPQLVGKGLGVFLNVVGTDPIVGFTTNDLTQTHILDTAQATTTIYPGRLEDLQDGVALTAIIDPQAAAKTQLLLNGQLVATEIGDTPEVIAGSNVAWIFGGVFVSNNPSTPLPSPSGDFVGLAASGNDIAWGVENVPTCAVYLNSVLVSNKTGCPDNLKVTVANGIVYVGWSDGEGVFVAQSKDSGMTWTLDSPFSGGEGVFGADYAVRSDGSLIVAWTQYLTGESGSSVWESDAGGLPVRLSPPVMTGFSGAGNPAVAPDGSVAWLDDVHGTVSGHFDVFLNGVDLSNLDEAIDEGPALRLLPDGTRVVAWDDETNVWIEKIPK